MSRLLKSLKEAQRERQRDASVDDAAETERRPRTSAERSYFFTSVFMLAMACALIVGGYWVLRDLLSWLPS